MNGKFIFSIFLVQLLSYIPVVVLDSNGIRTATAGVNGNSSNASGVCRLDEYANETHPQADVCAATFATKIVARVSKLIDESANLSDHSIFLKMKSVNQTVHQVVRSTAELEKVVNKVDRDVVKVSEDLKKVLAVMFPKVSK